MTTQHTPRIVITGFMCAGKTTVARALAARLNCAWLDLDEFIAARHGRTAAAIIDADGEPRFRKLETEALRAALDSNARIIALGGGAWSVARNRALTAQHACVVIWLDAPFELCWQRITAARMRARSRLIAHRPARVTSNDAPHINSQRIACRLTPDKARPTLPTLSGCA